MKGKIGLSSEVSTPDWRGARFITVDVADCGSIIVNNAGMSDPDDLLAYLTDCSAGWSQENRKLFRPGN